MNKKNRKNKERERERSREEGNKALGDCLLDHESSVEVGYGFYAIRSRLLIANDMCWVVCKTFYMLNCVLT